MGVTAEMSTPLIRSLEEGGKRVTLLTLSLTNAVFAFFFEGTEQRAGTLAVALPSQMQASMTSSVLLGTKNGNIARIAAEYLASTRNKMAYASVNLSKENDTEMSRLVLRLARNCEHPS